MIRKLYANQVVRVLSLIWIYACIQGVSYAHAALPGVINQRAARNVRVSLQPNFICAGGENHLEIIPGESATLQLSLDDARIYNGFQTDIALPVGITPVLADGKLDITLPESCNRSHIITTAAISAVNTYRVVVYSLKNEAFADGENLLNFGLVADEDFDGGEITISNTILTLTDDSDRRFETMTIAVTPYIPIQAIAVTPPDATIKVGETLQLTATIIPAYATDKRVTWTSSDEDVATVDANGNVSAYGIGYATITATTTGGNLSACSLIRVVPAPLPDDFRVNPTVSRTRIRDGNDIALYADVPDYGYADGWTCGWTMDNEVVAEMPEFDLALKMEPGDRPSTETRIFTFHAINYSPEGEIWAQIDEDAPEVTIYRAPETPEKLVRKGDGTTRVLIAMLTLDDMELSQRKYRFVFGYDDISGERHVVSASEKRYARYDENIFNDNSLRKWCYAEWIYDDGSYVSSGLRYLDGEKDDDFDASSFADDGRQIMPDKAASPVYIFNEHGQWRIKVDAKEDICIRVSTDTGIIVLNETVSATDMKIIDLDYANLNHGAYIVSVRCGNEVAAYKIYVR